MFLFRDDSSCEMELSKFFTARQESLQQDYLKCGSCKGKWGPRWTVVPSPLGDSNALDPSSFILFLLIMSEISVVTCSLICWPQAKAIRVKESLKSGSCLLGLAWPIVCPLE